MSQAYSEYRSQIWQAVKMMKLPRKTERDFSKSNDIVMKMAIDNMIRSCPTADEDYLDFHVSAMALEFWLTLCLKFKNTTHYFLDEGVSDFLISSVKELSSDYYKKESLPEIHSKETPPEEYPPMGFFIHFPTKERRESIGVVSSFHCANIDRTKHFGYLFGARDFQDTALIGKNHYGSIHYKGSSDDEIGYNIAEIVYGFSLYIDAFPDVVREADNIKHVGHYKGHRHSVRANDIVRTEATHSVSPHFRRGHFRLLQSEKFKAKRGQAIFIKGCFVKGHAFDVLADDGKSVGGVA